MYCKECGKEIEDWRYERSGLCNRCEWLCREIVLLNCSTCGERKERCGVVEGVCIECL